MNIQSTGMNMNNMMEMIKAQMMTMTMVSSMNSNNKNSDNNFINVIYIFIITGVIDFICKTIFPELSKIILEYYQSKLKSSKIINNIITISDIKTKTKSASITILVKISDHENSIGQSLLDYITNNESTKHISFKKQNFILNQHDIIEIYDDIFIKLEDNKNNSMMNSKDDETNTEQTIELFSYTKTIKELRKFLNTITHEYKIKIENKLGDNLYFFNQHPMNVTKNIKGEKDYSKLPNNSVFTMKIFQTNRKFTNLFGPEIAIVRKRVEFFIKNKKWYDNKGIPYTLGLLLSGQAGAGKTSSIKCLANETKRHIININLNNDISKTQLENLFFNELIVVLNISTNQTEKYYIPLDKRIYVLEDIDCQSDLVMERSLKNQESDKKESSKNDEDSQKIDLSFLLNLLDGILEIPGRIVIMTSNFPEKLDHALIRPGRIDVISNFKRCNHNTIFDMMEFFYDITLTQNEKNIIYKTDEYIFSPAEMSKIMFENFGDHNKAIQKIKDTIEISKPKNETRDNAIETSEHINKTSEPINETPDNVDETLDNVDETSNNVIETSNNVIETSELIIGTPVTSLSKTNKNINNIIDVPIDNLKEKINPQNLYYNSEEKHNEIFDPNEDIISNYTGKYYHELDNAPNGYQRFASCVGIESLDNDMTNYYSLDDNMNDMINYSVEVAIN
jgi:ATP-dependent 26S proteasome regulatory subunit